MSGHDNPHNDQHGHGHKSEDDISYWKVIVVGLGSLVIFALSTVWAALILSRESKKVEDATGVVHRPLKVEQEEIGIVDQVPFAVDTRLARWRAEHATRLNGFGWIDRGKGIAHVPIEQAMEKVAAGALPAGAPTGTAPTKAPPTGATPKPTAPAGAPPKATTPTGAPPKATTPTGAPPKTTTPTGAPE
jgi:hypothetical protein